MQKTWLQLLGRMQRGKNGEQTEFVDGNRIVRSLPAGAKQVLWTFDNTNQARAAFHQWWWEQGAPK